MSRWKFASSGNVPMAFDESRVLCDLCLGGRCLEMVNQRDAEPQDNNDTFEDVTWQTRARRLLRFGSWQGKKTINGLTLDKAASR